jgi:serine protease AprX
MPILKVFVNKAEKPAVKKLSRLIEEYDAFLLVEASRTEAQKLSRSYPVEDITDQFKLRIGQRTVPTSTLPATNAGQRQGVARATAGLGARPHHYIVQFIGPIKQSWLARVRSTGAQLRTPYGNFGYIVRASKPMLSELSALRFVRWIGHLPHRDRIAPGLVTPSSVPTTLPRRRPHPDVYSVEVFDSGDLPKIVRSARSLGFRVLAREPQARIILLQSESAPARRRQQIQKLSTVHGVRYIRQRVVPRTANNVATTVMGNTFTSISSNGLKLSGEGEIVAVCDTGLDSGDPATIHPDFAGRIAAIKSYPITSDWNSIIFNPGANDGAADVDSGHGTHVCGSILGNGTASANGPDLIRGHAFKATIVFQAVEQEMKWKPNAPAELKGERFILSGIPANLRPLFQFAYNQGARIHSNSWGGGDPGAYDSQCRQFDEFVWNNKNFCFVIAAGNDGTDKDRDGKINLMSVTSPGTAKNCITVGACENLRPEFNNEKYGDWWPDDFPVRPIKADPMADDPGEVVAFSSRGPTVDNRTKPEVVAPGTFILSTRSTRLAPNNFAWHAYPQNKKYFYMGGTSMATPLTAGAVALVREFLRRKRGIADPSAALLKALLIAGAQRLSGTAPQGVVLDNHQGFGRVNLDRSLKRPLVTIEGAGLTTGQKSSFTFNVPSANRTLRIVMAYTDFPGSSLVNNLNLIVTDSVGKRFVGNGSSSVTGALSLDMTNNVEAIHVTKAKRGNWTIEVIASSVSSGKQDFAIAAVMI